MASGYGMPSMNFDMLGNLGKTYGDAKNEATLANLGKGLAAGTLDYKQAAGLAAEAGRTDLSLSLLKLGDEQSADSDFMKRLPNLANLGNPNPAPSNSNGITSGPRPSTASPIYTMPPEPLQGQPPQRPIQQATEGIISAVPDSGPQAGQNIAPQIDAPRQAQPQLPPTDLESGGPIRPSEPSMPPNGQPLQQRPAVSAGMRPVPSQNPASDHVMELVTAAASPRLSAGKRELAKTLLTRALDDSKLTDQQKAYVWYQAQGGKGTMQDMILEQRRAGATAITNDMRDEDAFAKEFGKDQAKRWSGYITGADSASRQLVDINNMREISRRVGSQGAAADVKEALGPYAEALGVNIDGLSDIQAYTSIMQRLAPQQRVPGSGSTSDIEFKGFLKSLPGLSQNPVAREMTLDTMEAMSRHSLAEGEIASRLATKEINRGQAEKELRALPDPLAGFRTWRKANPDVYSAALKGGGYPTGPATSQPASAAPRPPSGAPPGAKLAPDGRTWVAPDPARPGKWLEFR